MLEKLKTLAQQYAPEFIGVRHHLHAHPELVMKNTIHQHLFKIN